MSGGSRSRRAVPAFAGKKPSPRACPCHSGLGYAACCEPLHKGTDAGGRAAEDAVALMRSRYSAFALGLGEYLVRTLASSHPDAQYDPTELARILSRTRESQRFLGLRILDARAGATASESEVLFYARIFERGVDRSFAELSTFVREGVGAESALRYASGILVPAARLPTPLEALTRDAFVALAERP